jgi:hypothetical protein
MPRKSEQCSISTSQPSGKDSHAQVAGGIKDVTRGEVARLYAWQRCSICSLTYTLDIFVPASALNTEMSQQFYPYFNVNLSTTGSAAYPTTFQSGNDAFRTLTTACEKATEQEDGVGLPGTKSLGSGRKHGTFKIEILSILNERVVSGPQREFSARRAVEVDEVVRPVDGERGLAIRGVDGAACLGNPQRGEQAVVSQVHLSEINGAVREDGQAGMPIVTASLPCEAPTSSPLQPRPSQQRVMLAVATRPGSWLTQLTSSRMAMPEAGGTLPPVQRRTKGTYQADDLA